MFKINDLVYHTGRKMIFKVTGYTQSLTIPEVKMVTAIDIGNEKDNNVEMRLYQYLCKLATPEEIASALAKRMIG